MADWREELSSFFQEAVKPLPLSPANILPQDRIIGSTEDDAWTGVTDEAGNREYQTRDGRKYFVRPTTQEERDARRSVPEKAKEWWDEGANLPSGEQVLSALAGMPQAYAETVSRVMDGSGTYADLLGSVGPTAAPGVASRVGTAFDPSVVSAMGATHKVPRYPKKEPVAPKIEEPETFNDEGFLTLENPKPDANYGVQPLRDIILEDNGPTYDWLTLNYAHTVTMEDMAQLALGRITYEEILEGYGNDVTQEGLNYLNTRLGDLWQQPQFQEYFTRRQANPDFDPWAQDPFDVDGDFSVTGDGFTNRSTIQFRDPLDEILSEMEIPPKGITGAQLLKELQDNPTVRMAQLRSQGVLERIDPAKRYDDPKARRNSREVDDLLIEGKYNVQAVPQNKYDGYQRQPVADKELNYVEYAIDAVRDGPTFKAKYQHYSPDTLAHVRLSERESASGNYVLIEELQSDLLQQGFKKPEIRTPKPLPDYLSENGYDGELQQWLEDFSKKEEQYSNIVEEHLGRSTGALDNESVIALREAQATFKQVKQEFADLFEASPEFALEELRRYRERKRGYERYHVEDVNRQNQNQPTLPPIAKMEESVRLGLETAIAHAAQNNIERVVIPPFHRIVEQRFTKGSEDYDKAMNPKSGFYQTYVGAVNKVLKKLNEDMGADVEVREFDLKYGPDGRLDQRIYETASDLPDPEFENLDLALSLIYEDVSNLYSLPIPQSRSLNRFVRSMRQIDPNFDAISLASHMYDGEQKSFFEALALMYPDKSLDDPGIEINFSNAIKNGYDLTRPRFAEGGLVLSNDENRWMREFNL